MKPICTHMYSMHNPELLTSQWWDIRRRYIQGIVGPIRRGIFIEVTERVNLKVR